MIGGGKPKAGPPKEHPKVAAKSRVRPVKGQQEKVKKEEPVRIAKAVAEVKHKSAERVTPMEGEPMGKSAESMAVTETKPKGKSAESVAKVEAEPKGKSAESVGSAEGGAKGSAENVVNADAEPKRKSVEDAQDQKKTAASSQLEALKKKSDVPKKEPAAQEEGALAGLVNLAGDILFGFGTAMINALQKDEANEKRLNDSAMQRVTASSASAEKRAQVRKTRDELNPGSAMGRKP